MQQAPERSLASSHPANATKLSSKLGVQGRSPFKRIVIGAAAVLATGMAFAASRSSTNPSGVPVVTSPTGTTSGGLKPGTRPASEPPAAPIPTPAIPAPTLAGLDPVASGIDVYSYLVKSWGTGAIPELERGNAEGAFRFLCAPSHNAYDDPIVYPAQPGKSHLHTFFGNTEADAFSTYASLRTTGESTCNNLLNRSAYWMPAMMNGRGKVVMPDWISIYYKRYPSSDPYCTRAAKACVPLPRGLRYVFGFNMATGERPPYGKMYWNCEGAGGVSGWFDSIPEAAQGCPAGDRIGAVIVAPNCWNGKDLDSPDHRSHMAYMHWNAYAQEECPATHPYIVPAFQLGAWYTTDNTLDRSGNQSPDAQTWYLASDRMAGMANAVPGTTLHGDWFGAWEDSVIEMWTDNCINKRLSCSGGDLGNGQQMALLDGYKYPHQTTLVDTPARP